jgi:hypothetical protein
MFITNDLIVSGTISAFKIVTTIESSSVIFSSGSNILGDSTSDIQTLNGSIIMSGSSSLTGSMGITGDLNVLGNISSSTISGIGNVTTYSQSVDARLDIVEATASLYIPFSQSVDSRLDYIELFTSSANISLNNLNITTQSLNTSVANINSTTASLNTSVANINLTTASLNTSVANINSTTASLNTFTASAAISITNLNLFTASLNVNFVTSASFNAYTASANGRLNNLELTTASLNTSITSINSKTGSYATTGSNVFSGSQIITGSVDGNVNVLSIASNTASMDLNNGNFYELTLPSTSNSTTRLNISNIHKGTTLSMRVIQTTSSSSLLTFSSNTKFPSGSIYIPTQISGAVDVVTFIAFETSSIYATAVKNIL